MRPPSTAPNMMNIQDVMELLVVSKPIVYRLVARNQFPEPYRIGNACKWIAADVYRWLGENRGISQEPAQLKAAKDARRSKDEGIAA